MKRKQRTREEKLSIVADWKASGLTAYRYAKEIGITRIQIERWAKGEGLGMVGRPSRKPKSNAVFVPQPPQVSTVHDEVTALCDRLDMPRDLLIEQALRFALDHMEKPRGEK